MSKKIKKVEKFRNSKEMISKVNEMIEAINSYGKVISKIDSGLDDYFEWDSDENDDENNDDDES